MKFEELRDKEKLVFMKIVEQYLVSGSPVSSASVSNVTKTHMPPATVRYIMAKLEDKGLLQQPHTSSGRIPTDNGLRLYVGNLLDSAAAPDTTFNTLFD